MKFFGNGLVWDKDNNKNLCKFDNGEFETEDKRSAETKQTYVDIIERLI